MLTIYDFLPDIVGSLIGVFLGFVFGIYLERKMRSEESKEKNRLYLDAILQEINNNEEIMNNSSYVEIKFQDKFGSYYPAYLSTESLESGIYSGEFQYIPIKIQTKLTKYLQYCNIINSTIDTLNFSLLSDIQGSNLAVKNFQYFTTLKNYIPELIKDLES